MKKTFTIKEVARLYGVCPDTLRYYEEQGLLHPQRSKSNYRLYSISDICNLNIIRGLRALDIPIERLRLYFEDCTLDSTLALLDESETVIDTKIAALRSARRSIEERKKKLTWAGEHEIGKVHIRTLPDRPCLRLKEPLIREAEVDWVLRRLAVRHEGIVKLLGSQPMGAVLDESRRQAGMFDRYESVFFLGCSKKDADDIIQGGEYACLFYKGAYTSLPASSDKLDTALKAQGLAACGEMMELYHIDANDTGREEEYLTELQVRLIPQKKDDYNGQ